MCVFVGCVFVEVCGDIGCDVCVDVVVGVFD